MSKFTFPDSNQEEERHSAKRVDKENKRTGINFYYIFCRLLTFLLCLGQEGIFCQVYKPVACTLRDASDGGVVRARKGKIAKGMTEINIKSESDKVHRSLCHCAIIKFPYIIHKSFLPKYSPRPDFRTLFSSWIYLVLLTTHSSGGLYYHSSNTYLLNVPGIVLCSENIAVNKNPSLIQLMFLEERTISKISKLHAILDQNIHAWEKLQGRRQEMLRGWKGRFCSFKWNCQVKFEQRFEWNEE